MNQVMQNVCTQPSYRPQPDRIVSFGCRLQPASKQRGSWTPSATTSMSTRNSASRVIMDAGLSLHPYSVARGQLLQPDPGFQFAIIARIIAYLTAPPVPSDCHLPAALFSLDICLKKKIKVKIMLQQLCQCIVVSLLLCHVDFCDIFCRC